MDVFIDSTKVAPTKLTNYKGMMFSQMPNFHYLWLYKHLMDRKSGVDLWFITINHMERHAHLGLSLHE